MSILVLNNVGIHRLAIRDSEGAHVFGPNIARGASGSLTQEKITFKDQTERPVGLFGSWKFNGLHSLGVITLNTDCIPKDGVYVAPKKEEEKVRIVEVIKEVKGDTVEVPIEVEVEKEKADPIPLIVLAVVFFVTVACILFYCLHCIRSHKKRIEVLETEKKETPPVWNESGKRRKLV